MDYARLPLLFAFTLAACDGGATTPADDAGVEDELVYRAECENVSAVHCLLPWPSDRWLVGGRVAIDPAATPVNAFGDALDPALFHRFDGFSPATPIVTSFPGVLDRSLLAGEGAIARTLEPGSTTVIVDTVTGERVAHFAEVDEWAETDPARAPLYLRPAARLAEGRRYVVGIRGLRTMDGAAVPPSAYFRRLRDGGDAPGTDLAARGARFSTEVFDVLEAAGVPRAELIEAWDFTTASGERLWGDLVAMRDDALEAVGERGLGCSVVRVVDADLDEAPSHVWRQIYGTVTVPLFSHGTSESSADARVRRDAAGRPMHRGTAEVPFVAQIPLSVRDAVQAGEPPARIELYGHGLFGSRVEITYGWHREHQERLGLVSIAVDWWGMSDGDLSRITRTLQDLSDFDATAERLAQSVINALVLARSFRGVCAELPELQVPMPGGGTMPSIDPSQLYYYGNSQGGIMGGVLAGVATDIERFALGVGGMSYPQTIKRSTAWVQYGAVMAVGYPDALERDLLMAMVAPVWDLAEPSTYTPHWLRDPLPGTPIKRVLMQIGIGDALVSNASSYLQARTAGLPVLTPSPVTPWGLETTSAPADSALVIWQIPDVPPLPPGTRSPGMDNAAHEAVRRTDSARDQIDAFFRPDGRVEQRCDGPCDPE
ncbi:MAG: hypothetical protein KF729_26265 [Sandaracinaceae bacterium]|nr:hypothetical protein [Sandaracinaceae bacterium]